MTLNYKPINVNLSSRGCDVVAINMSLKAS